MRFKRLLGPETVLCAYVVNVSLLTVGLCLWMASSINNLTLKKTVNNFSSNAQAATSISIHASRVLNNCWNAANEHEWSSTPGIMHEAHAWYCYSAWLLGYLLCQWYFLLVGFNRTSAKCWYIVTYLHKTLCVTSQQNIYDTVVTIDWFW